MSANDGAAGPSKTVEEQAIDANASTYWRLSQQLEEEDVAIAGNNEQDGGARDEHDVDDDDGTGVGEDDTTTDGGDRTDGGARTDDASSDPAAKKKERKDRTPQVLAPICEEITEVSASGLPVAPAYIAKGYSMQLGCIVRESMSINTKHIRSNPALVDNIITKLHKRYKFLAKYDNLDIGNAVNRLAVTKMSNALSS